MTLSFDLNARIGKDQMLEMHSFNSSNIHSALYDRSVRDLYVRFHGDRIYVYLNVPDTVWTEWLQASSAGSYHHENIKWEFVYEELTASDWPQQGRAAPANNQTVRRFLR
ncbi:KTSC domain-containing protein [Natronolimnohabitans sp. A-GB9]|uniref:KTSC domain-containing protein n=1 Tax=Natronolimnohabitans sp. A-GB9 TaxID=3069757 RepID=UPI0027B22A54|nr:KTSC domain-containing protein [Natronolimnohabitans sp. A-GB9]MDQ2052849.1 KTSC domain-containing protein [Natronolimnohabitans sp. A-GB9]